MRPSLVLFVLGLGLFLGSTVTSLPSNNGSSVDESDKVLRRFKRIIGGMPASVAMHPWTVSLKAKPIFRFMHLFRKVQVQYCGGVLINPRWVLTAAHCMYAETDSGHTPSVGDRIKSYANRFYNALFGDVKHQAYYHIDKLYHHPLYNPENSEYDIALMRLKETPVLQRLKNIQVIGLPMNEDRRNWPPIGQICTAVGWGCNFADGPVSEKLQVVEMPIVDPEECRSIYVSYINLTQAHEFCAGYHNSGRGVCPGDSGGPLVCSDQDNLPVLAGVVSATHSKVPSNFPAIFTRVSYFVDWIMDVIEHNSV